MMLAQPLLPTQHWLQPLSLGRQSPHHTGGTAGKARPPPPPLFSCNQLQRLLLLKRLQPLHGLQARGLLLLLPLPLEICRQPEHGGAHTQLRRVCGVLMAESKLMVSNAHGCTQLWLRWELRRL